MMFLHLNYYLRDYSSYIVIASGAKLHPPILTPYVRIVVASSELMIIKDRGWERGDPYPNGA